ncbi:MAG: hypothetical protein M3383_08435 [Actinomycetota bacterium]|nr:hypothetical protein [Actinomycetota bacterium]
MSAPALFRFGFLCVPAPGVPRTHPIWNDLAGQWPSLEVEGLIIYGHPEAPLERYEGTGGRAVLIGEAFASAGTVASVITDLFAADEDDDFFAAFNRLSGRFVLLFFKGSIQRALHDPIGSRSLYYRSGQEIGIGSHAELVARTLGHRRSAEVREILNSEEYRSRTVKYLPGDLTVYAGVHGLAPNNYYDIRAGRTVRYWPRRSRRETGFEQFRTALDGHLAALASHLRDRHTPILGVTGGIDTRTIIAAFNRFELPFHGATWLRGKGGADERERSIIDGLTAAGSFEHTYMDLSRMNGELRSIARLAKRNAGRFGQPSRTTAHLDKHFGRSGAAFVRGYGAEILRGFYNLPGGSSSAARQRSPGSLRARIGRHLGRRRTRPVAVSQPTPAALLNAYDSSMRLPHPGPEHTRLGLAAFEGFAARASFDQRLAGFGFDLSDIFYWEHRMGMWGSAKHNEMDPALLSIAGFNSRSVYEAAFGTAPQERLTKELLLRVISRYDQELAGMPFV